jgi:predicted site-specific integrase-resolvase
MAKQYFTAQNCNIVVVGNEEVLARLKQFDADGRIELLDAFGEEVKDIKKADISKEKLVENYLLAVSNSTSLTEFGKKMKKVVLQF